MSAKTSVDSNILIYAYDRAAGAKKVAAEEVL
jgi:predicted nucleic acid-binding protein